MPNGGANKIGRAGKNDSSSGTVPRKGNKRKGKEAAATYALDGSRKTGPNKRCWPFRRKVGVMLRGPPSKGRKRLWRSESLKAWRERGRR